MRLNGMTVKKLVAAFKAADRPYDAADLIDAGANPLVAWLHMRGLGPETINTEIDFVERVLKVWPKNLKTPDAEGILKWLMPERTGNPLKASHLGDVSLDAQGYYDFCMFLGITPDQLLPRNKPIQTKDFCTDPAPRAIVDAAVLMYLDMKEYNDCTALKNFLLQECQKADKLGQAQLYPDFSNNQYLMDLAYSVYKADAGDELDVEDDDDDWDEPLALEVSPILIIEENVWSVINAYNTYLESRIKPYAEDMTAAYNGTAPYNDIIKRCASAVAPTMQGAEWLQAFNELKGSVGLEKALERIKKNPACVHPVHMFWYNSTLKLPDDSWVKGPAIIDVFADAYRLFVKAFSVQKNTQEALEGQYDKALSELMDFRTWMRAPQTETYIRALANCQYIEEELGGDIPGPAARNTPVAHVPVLSLPAPPRPANT